MANEMPIYTEIWPTSADSAGIWLVSGLGPWVDGPVLSDSEPHTYVENTLSDYDALATASLIHSTSWRVEKNYLLLSYVVVLTNSGLVLDDWPDARPIGVPLAEKVGPTLPYKPSDAPSPRHADVLLHAIRHLKFLSQTDQTNHAALGAAWQTHLRELEPALAGMYSSNKPLAPRKCVCVI